MPSVDEAIEMEKSKEIITGLCSSAPIAVRNCLRKYKYGKDHTYKEQYNSLFPSQKSVIVETLVFLGCGCIQDWKDIRKPDCVHELVCRLQNLLPDNCDFCKELYTVDKNDVSLLACAKCGQEAHRKCILSKFNLEESDIDESSSNRINKLMNPFELDCIVYLCGACKAGFIPKVAPGKKSKANDVFRPSCSTNNSFVPLSTEIPYSESGTIKEHVLSVEREMVKSNEVCPHLLRGNCQHGISGKLCKYIHKPLCKKHMKFGSCNQQDCNKLHPKLCPKSLTERGCTNKSCSFRYHAAKRRVVKSTAGKGQPNKYDNRSKSPQSRLTAETTEGSPVVTNLENDFLFLMNKMKTDILFEIEMKLATLLSQNQRIQQPPQFYPPPHLRTMAAPFRPPTGMNFPPFQPAPIK